MNANANGPGATHLANVLEDKRIVVCVGSGGVGKTTTAAALALYSAAIGKRTLVITIDPARRLANSLGLDHLAHRPKQIQPALLEQAGIKGAAPLDAMTLDLAEAWDDLVRRTSSTEEAADRILQNRLYLHMSRDLPGAQEFIACEALYTLVEERNYDLVILDTPPTANALDFLDAPDRILAMLDTEAFKVFSRSEDEGRSLGLKFLDGASGAIQSALAKFTGTRLLEDLGGFLTQLREIYGPLRDRTRALQEMLRGDSSRFIIVTSPQPGPLQEAIDFNHLLRERGLPIGALVANRTMPWPPPEAVGVAPADLAVKLGPAVPEEQRQRLSEALSVAVSEQLGAAERDLRAIELLEGELREQLAVVVVPRMMRDVVDVSRLAELLPWLVGHRV